MEDPFDFTHAIVGRPSQLISTKDEAEYRDALREHSCYVRLLREIGLEVVEIDWTQNLPFPENIFVESSAVICNGIALLAKSSKPEESVKIKMLKNVLESDMGIRTTEIESESAKLNGSDVLFTGREFFVGLSETSNEEGACAVASTFPEYPCTLIKTLKPKEHIKSYVTMGGPDLLCVSSCQEAKDVLKYMERQATFSYQTLTLPEKLAANCVYVNGTLIHRAIEEIPESFKVFCVRIEYSRRSLCYAELGKKSLGLSACVLLARLPKI